ncbi:hypothetical protein [Dactylosporangium darangshiense]|uniref:hypothetical protein n=1 Tax=Dactylosporangium darangshiense TaxID=579108 RepID=UPI0036317F19
MVGGSRAPNTQTPGKRRYRPPIEDHLSRSAPDLGRPRRRRAPTGDDAAAIQQLYSAGTLTVEAIAERFGTTKAGVYAVLDPATTGGRPNSPRKVKSDGIRRSLRPGEIDQLRRMQAVAAGVRATMPADHPDRRTSREYADLLAGYLAAGLTMEYLAGLVGVSRAALIRRLGRYGHRPMSPSVTDRTIAPLQEP